MTLVFREPTIPDSPLARWDPRWKLAAILCVGFGLTAIQSPLIAALGWLLTTVLALIGRIPVRAIRDRWLLVGVAVLPVLLVVPLSGDADEPGWSFGPVRVSEPATLAAVAVAFRALGIGMLALVLVRTAPLPQTLAAAHALRIPGVLVQIASLAYRYAFLLASEARRMQVALRTRGFQPGTNRHTYRTLGGAVGGLLVRGGDRSEAVAAAMRCRGFDGRFHTLSEFRTHFSDAVWFVGLTAGIVALLIVEKLEQHH